MNVGGLYGYTSTPVYTTSSAGTGELVWMLVSAIIAIVGAFVLYFTFLSDKNENKFTGFTNWLYEFLTFKKMTLEVILKIAYLVTAIFITLSSLSFISISFWFFLGWLIGGNIISRLVYEGMILILMIHRNTKEINSKLGKEVKVSKKEN